MLQIRGSTQMLKQMDSKERDEQERPGGKSKAKGKGKAKSKGRRKRGRASRNRRPAAAAVVNGSSAERDHPRMKTKLELDPAGAPECPCITNSSSFFRTLQADIAASGFPEGYGTMGCKAYDMNNTKADCKANTHSFCFSPWCYVDPELCPVNETVCQEAGGQVGSMKSPACRTRDVRADRFGQHQYSYATCGSLSTYGDAEQMKALAGRVIRIAVDTSAPYLVTRLSASGEQEFSGPLYDFFSSAMAIFEPKPSIEIVPVWATNDSKAMFASSHTACTHDVAVGAIDICVADLWRTPGRALMADFTPTIRSDSFYLIVPHKLEGFSVFSHLKTPFLPFSPGAWAAVLGFLAFMALFRWMIKLWFEGGPRTFRHAINELGHFIYLMSDDFLESASDIEAEGLIPKAFRLAFAFFVLVIMASYTASLASMLVVQRHPHSEIGDITSAIDNNVVICAPVALKLILTRLYPQASFVYSEWLLDSPRQIYNGTCGAAIMSKNSIAKLHAGYAQQRDCEEVALNKHSEEEMRCEKGLNGVWRDDCKLQPVGDVIVEIPIAFPVNTQIARSMTWAFTKQWASGMWEEAVAAHDNLFPHSQCETTQRNSEDGLHCADLIGTIVISSFIVVVGVCCHVSVYLTGFNEGSEQ